MDTYQLIDLATTAGQRIDVQWGFFITVHMAILGGVVYVDRPLRATEKLFAIFLYLGFAVMNYGAMRMLQNMHFSLITDVYQSFDSQSNLAIKQYYQGLVDREYIAKSKMYTFIAHCIATLVVLISIATDKKVKEP